MAAEPAKLLALAEAVSDGVEVDWAEAELGVTTAEEAALVQQLKLLAGVASVSRSASASGHASAAPAPAPPRTWGTLELRDAIGSGTFGTVYRAWDPRLQREVALKLLNGRPESPAAEPDAVIEGRRLALVRHPHVVVVHGADRWDGQVGIWMEYIQGRTLETLLAQHGALGAREAALIGVDLCAALAAVHAAGLVHRDIKAQNIMREEGGRIVLMDFGAGDDHSEEGWLTTGTPIYMAPELFTGAAASVRSDIYSLGVLLFRLVTGSYPVNGRTSAEIAANHAHGITRRLRDLRPDLAPGFVALVERALASNPEERFASAGEMESALGRVLARDSETAAPSSVRRNGPRFIAALAAALVAISILVWLSSSSLRHAASRWFAAPEVSVAVLPFANPSGEAAQEHVTQGVREVLVSRLAIVSALRVIVPSRPIAAGGAPPDVNRLGADYLIEGSARREGNRLRVTARLLRAGTGEVVWSEAFDRAFEDLFALQSEIASALARGMGVAVSEGERQRLALRYSASAEAQDAYLQGRALLYRFNRAAAAEARGHFERAVQIDPGYALAHASLARLYLLLQEYRDLTPAEARPLAEREARRAAELGPELAEARVALAEVLFKVSRNASGADAEYRAALGLSPGSSLVRSPYARFLSALERTDEALTQAMQGARLDPLSPEMMASVAITQIYRRDFGAAIEWYERAIAANPDYAPGYFGRGRARAFLGQFKDAVEDLRRAVALSGGDPSYLAELGRINAAAGWRNAAEEVLGALLRSAQQRPGSVAPQDLAYVYLALGDRDRACALLQDALAQQDTRILFLRVDPRVDALRTDPRFDDLIRALGL